MPIRFQNAYEMGIAADRFLGIDESAGYHNAALEYAVDAENCDTSKGILAPAAGYMSNYPALSAPIVTLATFYRRNHAVEAERNVLVAATATTLYAFVEGASAWTTLMTDLTSGKWSWLTYETTRDNGTPSDASDDYVTDILMLSNASDGVVVVYGDTLTAEKKTDLQKFALIARHAERVWGTGVDGDPDTLYYSRPFLPFDWNLVYSTTSGGMTTDPNASDSTGTVLPEESGGSIQVPTWDGDKFVALRRFSNYLLAFKQRTVFYVKGMTAGEFQTGEAYGSDGVFAPDALVIDSANAYYLSDGGMGVYDGDTAQMLDMDRLDSVFRRLGSTAATVACAAVLRHVIYMAVPVMSVAQTVDDDGFVSYTWTDQTTNNVLVEYDVRRGTYMKRTGINVNALLRHAGKDGDKLLFTSGDNPSQVCELTGTTYDGDAIPVKWVSAWQDSGMKNTVKSDFMVYLTGVNADGPQDISISIETEKKKKTKTIALAVGHSKPKFKIANKGRKWRLIIEADSEIAWSIDGGIQIDMALERD